MGKSLVIVESPAKAKTINKLLGPHYVVKASMGHIRDLPEKSLGVSIPGFEPEYVNIPGRAKVLAELRKLAAGADRVYLAPDPDREGEAIAWHLREALKDKVPADHFSRVTYNEITAPAIREAFAHPGEINFRRVDSQQARRVLDRIVGYKVSPVLWRRIRGANSAGRVQSVALRLVCEREKAINSFEPEPFWVFGVKAAKQVADASPFTARLARIDGKKADIRSADDAARLAADLATRSLRVKDILRREVQRHAPPPFITSSLQQAASGALGYSPSRTMKIAQKLYEGVALADGTAVGLITYMRTDSTTIAQTAQEQAREVISRLYGADFCPARPNVYRNRSSAQAAHEAIRPTDPARIPDDVRDILAPEEWRLYDLIWRRFMASQMAPARIALRTAELEAVAAPGAAAGAPEVLFRATASELLFPGFMRASGLEKKHAIGSTDDENDSEVVAALPELAPGEPLDVLEWIQDRKETQPPPRYTEASLVKALEENGVGRPSTYAQIISTLLDRHYVDREKRTLVPSSLGMQVSDFLVEKLGPLFDVAFTADMEAKLDQIEDGDVQWHGMLKDFYGQFEGWMASLRGPEVPREEIAPLLDALSKVTAWRPATGRGRFTYSDEKFVGSVRRQYEQGQRPFTDRQKTALLRLVSVYKDQLPAEALAGIDLDAVAAAAAGTAKTSARKGAAASASASADETAPGISPETCRAAIALLDGVTFRPARKIRNQTFDDAKFVGSLRDQVSAGRVLSERQFAALGKTILHYVDQIPDADSKLRELGLASGSPAAAAGKAGAAAAPADPAAAAAQAERTAAIIQMLEGVTAWREPTESKGRTWDDKAFFDSLRKQFGESHALSFKQTNALRRLASVYADQIPGYAERAPDLGLPAPRQPRAARSGSPRKRS